MRRSFLLPLVVAIAAHGCGNPELEARQWGEIETLHSAIVELRTYASDLEVAIDSLRHVAAKQDTALRLITDFTGAHVPGYRPPQ